MEKLSITDRFKESILDNDILTKVKNTPLSNANDTYKRLIDKGIIKKRGYTLRGIEDNHLLRFRINR